MHATYYSNERFSAFQTYILPLQYELNLNSFIYLNKIYNNDCCEVKHLNSFVYFKRSIIIIIVNLNHHLCIIFTAHHMITLELDMNYVYYMNSNLIF